MRNSIHSVGGATAFAATSGDAACRSVAVALAPDIRRLGLQDESELCRILLSLEFVKSMQPVWSMRERHLLSRLCPIRSGRR